MSSIKKNLGYQTLYQLIILLIPLVTVPYLSRVLGATHLGIFSYTFAVVNYFMLFAVIGTVNYGTRSIASVKNDNVECGKVFVQIFLLQVITGAISIALYIVYMALFCKDNLLISYLQMIMIIACIPDISWLYFGLEKFKVTITRNLVVKGITFTLIFLLVKTSDDLWLYTLLMAGGTLLSQFILWIKLPISCKFKEVKLKDVYKHIKPNIILFIPLLAMSIYHITDKTMLGAMSDYEQCGLYYNADRIVNIPMGIIAGISSVLLPRIVSLIEQNMKERADVLFIKSLKGVALIGSAIAFGLTAIAPEFTPIFFGPGYDNCVSLISYLSIVLMVKGYSITIRTEYLVPNRLEKHYTYSVIAGAIANIAINIILIPRYGALGAVIGTVIAESIACVWQIISITKYIRLNKCIINCMQYVFYGIIMYACVRLVANRLYADVASIFLEVTIGVVVYILLCLFGWYITNDSFGNAILNAKRISIR